MAQASQIVALVVAALNVAVAAGAGCAWWQVRAPVVLWRGWRVAQLATTALAGLAGAALVSGFDPGDGLYWLYMLLPIAVAIIAEQLRIAAAQTVLDQRELPDAQAVGQLPAAEQQAIVGAILAREIAIVGLAAVVIAFLALRVLTTL